MRYILSRQNREILAQLAWSNVLMAFDYDGTLAPIVDDPQQAKMRVRTRRLLRELAERYPCVVISGRGADDVAARLGGAQVRAVVGNHGLEPDSDMQRFEQAVLGWLPHLERAVAGLEGVELENKRYSAAVHYRRSRARKQAVQSISAAVDALGDAVRVVPGKCVINVLPEGAPHKGFALQRLRRAQGADIALYVGDDETDEDVFGLDEPGRLLGIRVGKSMRSRASYFLTSQREMDALLELMVSLRPDAHSRRAEELQ
jgi:trehalose 6-phosphate phosphatase